MNKSQHNYEDSWKLILSSDQIYNALANLSQDINEEYGGGNVAIIGILTGVIYFSVDLSRRLTCPHTIDYIRISTYRNQIESSDNVQFIGLSENELTDLSGKHVLIIDELYDTGKTLNMAVKYVEKHSPLSIKTCVMFHKRKTTKYPMPDFVGISELPDVWYVGYGLDDKGYSRNLKELYGVPKPYGYDPGHDDVIFEDDDIYKALIANINL